MSRSDNHWTAEEYREYLRTGKEPRRGASPTCCQAARRSVVSMAEMDRRGWPGGGAEEGKTKRRSKYGSQKTELNGVVFDSQHEAEVYQELMLRVRAGELKCVCRQVKFDLGSGYHVSKDSRYQYVADFVTIDQNGLVEVIDAKSEATRKIQTYINKKKQMRSEWGIEIKEV